MIIAQLMFNQQQRFGFKPGVSNTRPAGRMRPAKLFCAARGHVHEQQQQRPFNGL